MKYYDKKKKRSVVLAASEGEYLVKFKEGQQGETLVTGLSRAERLKSVKWVPRHFVTTVTFDKAATRSTSFKNTLAGIREDESVEDVIPVFKDEEGFQRLIVPGRLLVAYKPGAQKALRTKLTRSRTQILEMSRFGNWLVVGLREGEMIEDAIVRYNEMDEVDYAEPVYYGVNDAEDVGGGPLRWNLEDIDIADAWRITAGAENILIAVIDGMPNVNHPAIKSAFPEGIPGEWDFSDTQTQSSHSTQILSILVADGDDLKGIAPGAIVAPLAVTLEAQYYHQRAEAIFYLAEVLGKGRIGTRAVARAIANCSWKTSGDVAVIRSAIETAAAQGVIFVTSAGNESSTGPHYPSDYSKTINGVFSVAALAPNNQRAPYSNYSTTVSICAPGGAGLPFDTDDIYCADLNDTNTYTAGTSFAAPHLAGTIALMLSVAPRMSFDQIRVALEKTAVPLKNDNPETWPLLGYGKLNAGGAVKAAGQNLPAPQPEDPGTPGVPDAPTNPEAPSNPDGPENPEAPSEPTENPAGNATGPKIDITADTNNQTPTPRSDDFINRVTEEVSEELHRISENWETGDLVRITLEGKGRVTVLDCQA